MYWGCRKYDCHGCIAKFKGIIHQTLQIVNSLICNFFPVETFTEYCLLLLVDLNFGKKALENLILENPYESELFKVNICLFIR